MEGKRVEAVGVINRCDNEYMSGRKMQESFIVFIAMR